MMDVLSLSEEIESDSQSGTLAKKLLQEGQTLYSPSQMGGSKLVRILPCGTKEEGYLIDGEFVVEKSLPHTCSTD
jgi:hypothetical protein